MTCERANDASNTIREILCAMRSVQTICEKHYTRIPDFLKIFFFGVTCHIWLSFICLLYLFFFCHQVVHLIHLVFRWTRELNPRPRTMAQTVSPWYSPLDQGASPRIPDFLNVSWIVFDKKLKFPPMVIPKVRRQILYHCQWE